MLQDIITTVRNLVGSEYLYPQDAVTIKINPHTYPVNIWALCVSPDNQLFVMDADENWFEVTPKDALVVPSIYQRVKQLERIAA